MDRRKFFDNQLVQTAHLDDVQIKNENYLEKYGQEVVSIDNFCYSGLNTLATDPASMNVILKLGSGWKNWKNIVHPEDYQITIQEAHPTLPRLDTIAIKYATREYITENLTFRNPDTGQIYNEEKLTFILDYREIIYLTGTPAEVPVAPEVPEDALGSSNILVQAGATQINQEDITDIRNLKPDYLVGSHRTQIPIDHPNGSIFNIHIASTADIDLTKIDGIDFDSLFELLYFDTNLNLEEDEDYIYDASDRLTQIDYPRRAIQEKYYYNESGQFTYSTIENSKWLITETYTFSGSKIIKVSRVITLK